MKRLLTNDGVVLVIVLWTIVILGFLLISLIEDIQVESFLTRNLIEQTSVQQIAQSGIARGLAELTKDETLVDGKDEQWLMPITGQIEDAGSFEVTIEEIGSRFNLNYIKKPLIETLMADFSDELIVKRKDNFPLYVFQDLATLAEQDVQQIRDKITFYGKLNINTDDLEILKLILLRKNIAEDVIDKIIFKLNELEEPLTSLDDLLFNVPGLGMGTLNKIDDEVDFQGNINLNLVTKDILYLLFDGLQIPRSKTKELIAYLDRETIDHLRVLDQLVDKEVAKKLKKYLTVNSKYFRIISKAKSNQSPINKTIIVEVERLPEKTARDRVLEWSTKILSWVES